MTLIDSDFVALACFYCYTSVKVKLWLLRPVNPTTCAFNTRLVIGYVKL